MKLSEAIMVGISVFKLNPQVWYCESGSCLVGIAAQAAGLNFVPCEVIEVIVEEWPWLSRRVDVPVWVLELPDYSVDWPYRQVHDSTCNWDAKAIISHLAVQLKLGNVSLERVVDWIAAVEPQEERADGGPGPGAARLEVVVV